MNKICTSIEQSKKLIELGIDVNTADMYYWHGSHRLLRVNDGKCEDIDVPAWSLSALLELIPKHIKQEDSRIYKFHIVNDDGIVIKRWNCSYIAEDYHNRAEYLSDPNLTYPTNIYGGKNENVLDAVFEMIVYLKENKLI